MRYVQYIGLAHVRRITASEWREVGVEMETVQWDASNGYKVPLEKFSEDVQRRFIEPDRTLIIVGQEWEPEAVDASLTANMVHEGPQIVRITDQERAGGAGDAGGGTSGAPVGPDTSAAMLDPSSGRSGGTGTGSTRTSRA